MSLFAVLFAMVLTTPARPQPQSAVYAITGAKVFTLAGPPVENGTVVLRGGKIAAVGRSLAIPPDAKVIDAKGLEVYPGLFDPVTQIGLLEINAVPATVDVSEVGDYNPDIVAATAVNPASAHIPVTRAAGITHVLAVPGEGGFDFSGRMGVIGGQASAIHLAGWTIDDMLIRRSVAMVLVWPTLETRTFDFSTFRFKERPFSEVKKEYEKKINGLSDWLDRARHYAQAEEKGSPARFERDLKLEALVPVVESKLPVLVLAESARDIRNAVEFCSKERLRMILAGAAQSWKVKDLLKEKKIPVILGPTESLPREEDEPYDRSFTTPAELHAAGIPIAFASFDTWFSRRLTQQAGTAVAYGLPYDVALKGVTLSAAQMLGLSDELGTIEPGKIANLIVTDGDPLEIRTQLRYLFIKGRLTSTDNKQRELYEEYRNRPRPEE